MWYVISLLLTSRAYYKNPIRTTPPLSLEFLSVKSHGKRVSWRSWRASIPEPKKGQEFCWDPPCGDGTESEGPNSGEPNILRYLSAFSLSLDQASLVSYFLYVVHTLWILVHSVDRTLYVQWYKTRQLYSRKKVLFLFRMTIRCIVHIHTYLHTECFNYCLSH